MTKPKSIIGYFFLFFFLIINTDLVAQSSTINLTIQNIEKAEGNIMIAVYEGEENFLDIKKAIATKMVLVEKIGTQSVDFSNLAFGEYAIAVFHDVNGNEQLDTNLFGVPKEPYGFSKNARSKWGPPKYEIAHFQLNQSNLNLVIDVKKWSRQ